MNDYRVIGNFVRIQHVDYYRRNNKLDFNMVIALLNKEKEEKR